jgi:hypothetical protein
VDDYTTRVELMAIPITLVIIGINVVLLLAGGAGPWAWVILGVSGVVLASLLIWIYSRRNLHPAVKQPMPAGAAAPDAAADDRYRVLVIADESCIDPAFAEEIAGHAGDRSVEALVIAPAIGSWLTRWTNDESAHAEARRHLDDTVTALARAGITARGQTGDDDPLQAADDGLRDFAAHEIMFVTKPGTNTDWLEKGVVEAARKRYPLPVSHIALPAG